MSEQTFSENTTDLIDAVEIQIGMMAGLSNSFFATMESENYRDFKVVLARHVLAAWRDHSGENLGDLRTFVGNCRGKLQPLMEALS